MTTETLLVELVTEELPPNSLINLSKSFADTIFNRLTADALTTPESTMRIFATPRRIGFRITKIKGKAENSIKEVKLVPKKIGISKVGKPTEILKNRLSSLAIVQNNKHMGTSDKEIIDLISTKVVGKQEHLFIEIDEVGIELVDSLQSAILISIKSLPIPKMMTYQEVDEYQGYKDIKFIRPAHKLITLHGERLLNIKALGIKSDQFSDGHRFLGEKDLKITHADNYENQLQDFGKVIVNFNSRKSKILKELSKKTNLKYLVINDALINEITALCEWPVVYEGTFDKVFLEIPPECLILTMQKNQKFIPVRTKNGLSNKFFIVSNICSSLPTNVIKGNERVLKARLSDAQFFFNLDQKKNLDENISSLSKVIYHSKLGNVYDRTQRLILLTSKWGSSLGLQKEICERAALLSKADLTSKMVNEFPELQGVMGRYYASHSHENIQVSIAIEEHYKPKFSGDRTPKDLIGSCLGLADRIESIVGLWSVGVIPTGEKDPMGMRRSAIGVVRILIENKINLNLDHLIQDATKSLNHDNEVKSNHEDIKVFFLDRLKNWLKEDGHSPANIEAVITKCNNNISELPERLKAVNYFLSFAASFDLCSANKRINNILKKEDVDEISTTPDPALFENEAEKILFSKLLEVTANTKALMTKKMYKEVLICLSELKNPVDNFFKKVHINTEDKDLKINRLCLLKELSKTMNQVAQLSLLVE